MFARPWLTKNINSKILNLFPGRMSSRQMKPLLTRFWTRTTRSEIASIEGNLKTLANTVIKPGWGFNVLWTIKTTQFLGGKLLASGLTVTSFKMMVMSLRTISHRGKRFQVTFSMLIQTKDCKNLSQTWQRKRRFLSRFWRRGNQLKISTRVKLSKRGINSSTWGFPWTTTTMSLIVMKCLQRQSSISRSSNGGYSQKSRQRHLDP